EDSDGADLARRTRRHRPQDGILARRTRRGRLRVQGCRRSLGSDKM
ncbi:MAG: Intracellular protease, partial [uncultured Rubrobacteraceae bacterium]